jgi:aubergine-like protein
MPDSIRQELFYTTIKSKINSDTPVISQFVASKTIMKDNDRIFINILRQINAKLGGDLWRMEFQKEISKKTMLVGIDVCHKGRQSIIGFCASYDQNMCKYFTQTCPQEVKGKEIISQQVLLDYFIGAFESYKEYNNGEMPDHVFVYRDGVGDSMRSQVIHHELDQLKQIVTEVYGDSKHPEITLIFVNKRVRQRFFEKQGHSKVLNPPQGTYVDQGFVEQSEIIDGKFDFFLTPHSVTQGSVKPTHFYVAENSSNLSKQAILNFTYALCYNYYNWPDSIKIPAPCMLADKIAIYRNEIGNIPQSVDIHRLQFYL